MSRASYLSVEGGLQEKKDLITPEPSPLPETQPPREAPTRHSETEKANVKDAHCVPRRPHVVICVTIIASTVAVILVIVCFSVTSVRLTSLEAEAHRSRDALRDCTPCRLLDSGVDRSWLVATVVQGETLCCPATQTSRETRSDYPLAGKNQTVETNLCAVHVYFEPQQFSKSPEVAAITAWSAGGNQAFIRGGIDYTPATGAFEIRQDGLYELYSHVTYGSTLRADANVVLTHRIQIDMMLTAGRYVTVDFLEDEHVVNCMSHDNHVAWPCHVSSITSTLYLRRGDQLSVLVSHIDKVRGDMKSTYFGLHRIGG